MQQGFISPGFFRLLSLCDVEKTYIIFWGGYGMEKKGENHPSARYPEDIQRNTDYWEEALSHVHQYLLSLKSGCVLY